MANDKPVIIKKIKKGGHGGHHGGAWKVAYADFVTAMMAFFLLLWLLNATTEEQKRGIANYFDPVSVSRSASSGSGGMLGGASLVSESGTMASQASQMHAVTVDGLRPTSEGEGQQKVEQDNQKDNKNPPEVIKTEKQEVAKEIEAGKGAEKKIEATESAIDAAHDKLERDRFEKAATELKQAIANSPDLKDLSDNLLIEQTPEGMRIQIVDKSKKEMFPLGSAEMFDYTKKLLIQVGLVAIKLPNQIEITGHTDSKPYRGGKGSNWELSAKRAEASRRALEESGLPATRIEEVTGKADREHLVPNEPESPMNRRISITLLKDSVVKEKGHVRKAEPAAAPVEEQAAAPVEEAPAPAEVAPVPTPEPAPAAVKSEAPPATEAVQQADATPIQNQEPVKSAPVAEKPAEPEKIVKKRVADTGPI